MYVFKVYLLFLLLLFLSALGLRCCVRTFSSCSERLLIEVASLVGTCRLLSAGSAVTAHSMWDHPGPGTEPVSPALAGGFLTTGPPGTSREDSFFCLFVCFFEDSFFCFVLFLRRFLTDLIVDSFFFFTKQNTSMLCSLLSIIRDKQAWVFLLFRLISVGV